jgi:hypothetical protein
VSFSPIVESGRAIGEKRSLYVLNSPATALRRTIGEKYCLAGHHVAAKVPGRCTGGISRTTGSEKARAVAAGERGVTVTVTAKSL